MADITSHNMRLLFEAYSDSQYQGHNYKKYKNHFGIVIIVGLLRAKKKSLPFGRVVHTCGVQSNYSPSLLGNVLVAWANRKQSWLMALVTIEHHDIIRTTNLIVYYMLCST